MRSNETVKGVAIKRFRGQPRCSLQNMALAKQTEVGGPKWGVGGTSRVVSWMSNDGRILGWRKQGTVSDDAKKYRKIGTENWAFNIATWRWWMILTRAALIECWDIEPIWNVHTRESKDWNLVLKYTYFKLSLWLFPPFSHFCLKFLLFRWFIFPILSSSFSFNRFTWNFTWYYCPTLPLRISSTLWWCFVSKALSISLFLKISPYYLIVAVSSLMF